MYIRKPRIRISPKGGIKLTNVGARIGSRKAGVNISRKGLSGSINAKGMSYNTRRGCSLNPLACCSVFTIMPGVIIGVALLIWMIV